MLAADRFGRRATLIVGGGIHMPGGPDQRQRKATLLRRWGAQADDAGADPKRARIPALPARTFAGSFG